jgi:large repetitive protein
LLVLTLFIFSESAAQMRELHRKQALGHVSVKGLSFYTPVEGYIAVATELRFTADSGRTFVSRPISNNVDYNGNIVNLTFGFIASGVHAFDKNRLLIYGDYGNVPSILRSTDGGLHFKLVWHNQPGEIPNPDAVQAVFFPGNGNTGYALEQHRILKSTDRGESWQLIYSNNLLSTGFNTLQVPDVNTIIASSNARSGDKLIRSTNGGNTWNGVGIPANESVYSISFSSSQKGWLNLISENRQKSLYKTVNGGGVWTLVNDPVKDPLEANSLYFMNDTAAFALQEGPMEVFKTIDGGRIWERVPRDNNYQHEHYPLNTFYFLNNIFWTGGPGEQIQINTNPAGPLVPNANFLIDTTTFADTRQVKLLNRAGLQHKFQWFVNGSEISNAYEALYIHEPQRLKDTIRLIAYNDAYRDTVEQIFTSPPLPFLSSADPMVGGAGSVITIRGFNFRLAKEVTFGGTAATFKIISDSVIQATTPSGATGNIIVRNVFGYGALPGFIYLPPPHIDAFTPRTGKSGNKIVITGSHFEYVKNVRVSGLPVQSFNTISPTQLEIILGSSGDGNIEVTTPGGSHTLAGFTALPEIFDFMPAAATQASRMSITGSGLDNVTGISIGGKPVTYSVSHSPTLLEVSIPEKSSGNIVITKGATFATKGTFTYLYKPVINSITPAAAEPGNIIVITGDHFNAVPSENIVSFGPVNGTVTQASTTQLTLQVPAGSIYGPLHVTSNMLTSRSDIAFDPTIAQPVAITEDVFSELKIEPAFSYRFNEAIPGDLDGDGRTDLLIKVEAATSSDTAYALLLLNTINGTSPAFTTKHRILLPQFKNINIADANNDGKPDICIVTKDGFVMAYENFSTSGQPDFRPSSLRLPLPKSFYLFFDCLITSGDLDSDGKADLIACASSGGTAIFRNLGNPGKINFDTNYYYHSYNSPKSFRLEDLDKDGKVDIITLNGSVHNLSTPGKLQLAEEIKQSDIPRYYQLASADLDEDGKPDVIYADWKSRNIYVQRNTSVQGTISFATSQPISTFYEMHSTIVNDFDGDGKPDIAAVTENGLLAIFRNTGTPGNIHFMPPQRINNYNYENFNYPVMYTGDFNNDKQADLLLNGIAPILYLNLAKTSPVIVETIPGYGTIGSEIMLHGLNFSGTTGVSFGGVPAASFKVISDTLLQAVIGNGGAGLISITNAAGTGKYDRFTFGPSPVISEVVPNNAKAGTIITIRGNHFEKDPSSNIVLFGTLKAAIVSADVNELKVIVPASAPYQTISVTTRKLTGYSAEKFTCIFNGANDVINETNFAPYISFPALARSGNYADIDGDGKLDIYAWAYDINAIPPGKMFILRNTSTLDSISFEWAANLNNMDYSVECADIDGDGKPDFISTADGKEIRVYLNNSTPGNISFATPLKVPYYVELSNGRTHIKDYDKDGRPDLVLIMGSSINFFRNISMPGHAAFEESCTFYYVDEAMETIGDDVDGDGLPDLITSTSRPEGLVMVTLINTSTPGNITFREEMLLLDNAWYLKIQLKDIDGDLKPDLSIGTILYRNLSTPGKVVFETSPYRVKEKYGALFQDLDGDGKADMLLQHVSSQDNREIYLQKNISTTGNFSFGEPYRLPSGNAYSGCFIADFNGDGKPEIGSFIENISGVSGLHIFPNITGNDVTLNNCASAPDSIRTNIKSLSYQWQIKSGTDFINLTDNAQYTGTTTAQLNMKSTPLEWNGNIYRCKTDTMYSISYTLLVNPNPIVNLGLDTFYCQYAQPLKIGTPAIEGLKYKWNIGGDTTSFIMATPSYDLSYVLMATNKSGCITKDTIQVAFRKPGTTPVVTLTAQMCAGGQVELMAGEAALYQWYDSNHKPIAGATSKTFTATSMGAYWVTGVINGCMWNPQVVIVSTMPQLDPPSIVRSGNMLVSSADATSRWYRDNAPVPGATGKTYTPDQAGAYTCRVTLAGCISNNSNTIIISALPFDNAHVIAGPNPVSRSLYISYSYNTLPIEITVYDIGGNRITEKITFTNQYELNMQALGKGMYFVHLTKPDTGETIVKKIVKQ